MERWNGIRRGAQEALSQRDYSTGGLLERLATSGVAAGDLMGADRASLGAGWIPGVELVPRKIYRQKHRGFFGEFSREGEGVLGALGIWPKQWATARMYAGSAKGFHIHPPHVPEGWSAQAWNRRLFGPEAAPVSERPYDMEQWDVMFFVQGNVEMILVDEREGLERRVMRMSLEGDDSGGSCHCGVVIPAGVAHALCVEGSEDAIMVYGTTTRFDPGAEGRIADGIERHALPAEWLAYLGQTR